LGLFSPPSEALEARACSIADRPKRLVGEMLIFAAGSEKKLYFIMNHKQKKNRVNEALRLRTFIIPKLT
jgi:hypothetical protein